MADIFNKNNNLTLLRFEHQKLMAQANIHARNIRILELKEEIERCDADIEAQKKVIEEQERQIQIHTKKEEPEVLNKSE